MSEQFLTVLEAVRAQAASQEDVRNVRGQDAALISNALGGPVAYEYESHSGLMTPNK
jgi:hypothetical protein